jgi:Apea-like HEPN
MDAQDLAPGLRDSLIHWLTEVYADLEPDFGRVLMSLQGDRWYALPSGKLQKFPASVLMNPRKIDEILFQNSKCWSEVELHARNSPAVVRHTSGMIGTKHGMRRAYNLQEVFRQIAPTPQMTDDNKIYLNLEEDPETVVDQFLSEILSQEHTTTVVWPIVGISVDVPLELDEKLSFRELTTDEKLSCLNFGITGSNYDSTFSPGEARWFGLVLESRGPKHHHLTDPFDPTEVNNHFQFQQDALEDFLICGSLIAETVVGHGGGHSHAPSIELGGMFAGGVSGRGVQNGSFWFHFTGSSHKIEGDERDQFVAIWEMLRGKGKQKGYRQIVNAARRLYYSSTRHKASDILVDLMISAESLYLDGEDKGELSYRLSLNASLWETEDPARRSEVFQLFRKAYSQRSKIVHGATFSETALAEICDEVRPLIKGAIKRAFDAVMSSGQLPKWETLLFK